MTALEVEQKNRTATYADCFRNNESRNGFRTWTGIMLQAVCFLSIPLRYEWSNVVLVAATNGYQFHLCVFQGKKFLLLYWLLFAWKLAYYGTVSFLPSRIQVIYTYIEHTDLLPPSRDRQRFPNSVCKPSLLTQTSVWHWTLFLFRVIIGAVSTAVIILGVYLIDRVGRRRLLLIGAIGMSVCEFIIAIVGVTVGNINPVTQAVNLPAQKVLIAFACMCVYFLSLISLFLMLTSFGFPFCHCLLVDIYVSSPWLGDLLYG